MMKKIYVTPVILCLAFLSCSKKNEPAKDCETNNYGTATVNFTNSMAKHQIVITNKDNSSVSRTKEFGKGQLSDTLHLISGSYNLEMEQVAATGTGLNGETDMLTTTKCSENTINVDF